MDLGQLKDNFTRGKELAWRVRKSEVKLVYSLAGLQEVCRKHKLTGWCKIINHK